MILLILFYLWIEAEYEDAIEQIPKYYNLYGTSRHMRVIAKVDIKDIQYDKLPSTESVKDLCRHIRFGGTIPPVKLTVLDNGKFKLKDGRHRILAHKLLGLNQIKAKFYTDKLDNAVLYCAK